MDSPSVNNKLWHINAARHERHTISNLWNYFSRKLDCWPKRWKRGYNFVRMSREYEKVRRRDDFHHRTPAWMRVRQYSHPVSSSHNRKLNCPNRVAAKNAKRKSPLGIYSVAVNNIPFSDEFWIASAILTNNWNPGNKGNLATKRGALRWRNSNSGTLVVMNSCRAQYWPRRIQFRNIEIVSGKLQYGQRVCK